MEVDSLYIHLIESLNKHKTVYFLQKLLLDFYSTVFDPLLPWTVGDNALVFVFVCLTVSKTTHEPMNPQKVILDLQMFDSNWPPVQINLSKHKISIAVSFTDIKLKTKWCGSSCD